MANTTCRCLDEHASFAAALAQCNCVSGFSRGSDGNCYKVSAASENVSETESALTSSSAAPGIGNAAQAPSTPRPAEESIISAASGMPKIEFQVILPYSRGTFTAALQNKFRVAIAATASAGCGCAVTKKGIDITRIVENAASAGARRRLQAASIAVDVSITMPNVEAGWMLLERDVLTKEKMNEELVKQGVASMTEVSVRPVLRSDQQGDGCVESLMFSLLRSSASSIFPERGVSGQREEFGVGGRGGSLIEQGGERIPSSRSSSHIVTLHYCCCCFACAARRMLNHCRRSPSSL